MSEERRQLYSIADIARHFSLPESTCRYYCKRFSDFIEGVGEGRKRRYRASALLVIDVIMQEMKKSRTAMAVEAELAHRFRSGSLAVQGQEKLLAEDEKCADGLALPPAVLSLLERQTLALEAIAKVLTIFTNTVSPVQNTQANSATYADLQKKIDRLEMLVSESEKTQQADILQLQTWLGRLLRRCTGQTA
ncbi:MAG: MerR family transcriptional regulator [Desulfovibrionaceae bacterium]|nr:MerR family transcriptional regulator [Desulfovibrionaceae bacterium]